MHQFFSNKKLIILLVSVIACMGLIAYSIKERAKTANCSTIYQ
ncbi:exported hypothetical protein [Carnobacterium maltaromaticum]|nr:exported hypothetical protein [Carnobacterium maltaromaticum]